ncbi:DUF692 domain-containing protein [Dokdonella sp.]|uniref:MNIO family bufferin maturase n=1 Tax=Dokdonella sp. TaxID=2291710 RepID=UPI001B211F20|nr:DUF692 domain-containing protein [Dokdonella sp.]MBO9661482.1 DUF692 domain-containing protein [Dokdonella sp.]
MSNSDPRHPPLGYGLGLRVEHYEELLGGDPAVDWLEALSENYLVPGGRPLDYLARLRERWPVVLHGVSLSIGSSDPLNRDYLAQLRRLAETVEPAWMSDHLCWTGVDGSNLHDLMPLPYTEEAIDHVAARVREVQDFLGRRILLENVSSYVAFHASQLSESQFLAEIARRADCLILLDVNNIHVSAHNHGFDARGYLDEIPFERVQQFHLAGHEHNGALIVDTHDAAIVDPVWDLYADAVRRFGPVSTMIERDDRIPPLADLIAELDRARAIAEPILRAAA